MIKIRTSNLDKMAEDFASRIINSVRKKDKYDKRRLSNTEKLEKDIVVVYKEAANLLPYTHWLFEKYLFRNYTAREIQYINEIYFDYENTIKSQENKEKHSHWLIRNVNVGVCPYCNRNFVQTHHAAQLDHFYPKDKGGKDAKTKKIYPYLALSFYNLIPCCYQCNHEKSTEIISVNPYTQGFREDSRFKIKNIEDLLLGGLLNDKNNENWKIIIDLQANETAHNKAFKLEEVYEQHKDIVAELVQKAYSYRGGYYDGLIQTFAEMGLKGNEIQTLIFGTTIQEENLGKRPLSKLTKDILEQLEIY